MGSDTALSTAETVLQSRYYQKDAEGEITEDWPGLCRRVAEAVGEGDEQQQDFYTMLEQKMFLANSPCLMNAGTKLNQLGACFVLPITDSLEGIYKALAETAMIQKTGGGTGFSFSSLRPRGDIVSGTSGTASGPVSFLRVFDASTAEIKQGGKRRGANMAVLNTSHPDIEEFITCKDAANEKITNFNLSVWVSDIFMECIQGGSERGRFLPRINPRNGVIMGEYSVGELFQMIVEQTWLTGDPGIIFGDAMQRGNPTPWLGVYEATNPCAEQPLLPYEACVLGSINLMKFVLEVVGEVQVEWGRLERAVREAVRFLDRCIDIQNYTLPQIKEQHHLTRKIGLGVMGWADVLSTLGHRYGDDASLALAVAIGGFIQEIGYDESLCLGQEKGTFPAFSEQLALEQFGPAEHKYKVPRRNATVTTIAPTGTISLIAGCSSGVEPHFALAVKRENVLDGKPLFDFNPVAAKAIDDIPSEPLMQFDGLTQSQLREFVVAHGTFPTSMVGLRKVFPTVVGEEISIDDHLNMQAAWQRCTDNGVSKTVNLPESGTAKDVADVYLRAHELGLKAVAIYRNKSKATQVLNIEGSDPEKIAPPVRVQHLPHAVAATRPVVLRGHTERVNTGLGALYVTVNERDGIPFEVFAQVGHAGSEVSAFTEGLARMTSLALRHGLSPHDVASQLIGIGGPHQNGFGESKILSVPDAIGKVLHHIADHDPEGTPSVPTDICPQCHQATLVHQEGCERCNACGYSSC